MSHNSRAFGPQAPCNRDVGIGVLAGQSPARAVEPELLFGGLKTKVILRA